MGSGREDAAVGVAEYCVGRMEQRGSVVLLHRGEVRFLCVTVGFWHNNYIWYVLYVVGKNLSHLCPGTKKVQNCLCPKFQTNFGETRTQCHFT